MSEQDKNSGGGKEGNVVMVEKSASSQHKPYRPNELQEDSAPELHKRPTAPAVPSVAEELKDSTVTETTATLEQMKGERAMSSEKHMHVSKNISSTGNRRGSKQEDITMVPLDTAKKDIIASTLLLPTPIPAVIEKIPSPERVGKQLKREDNDSITEEIAELRTGEVAAKEHSEWSDDEEAGGLPRSESRSSRLSRASRVVRSIFCCGATYSAPSEEDISERGFNAV